LKEIGDSAFSSLESRCAIKSIRIPRNLEVIGEGCFCHCKSLCEVTFEPGSTLRIIRENIFSDRVKCVIVPLGFTVENTWPSNCRIEYYDPAVAMERKTLNISGYI
jgi:hypothetical protein